MMLLLLLACGPEGAGGDTSDTADSPPPVDADGDGYLNDVDCDDDDPAVSPAATETCDNGLDDDCNQQAAACVMEGAYDGTTADMVWVGDSHVDNALGMSVAFLPDLDGDGGDEVAIASSGTTSNAGRDGLLSVYGSADWEVAGMGTPGWTLAGVGQLGYFGAPLVTGDLDGDGIEDLLVAASQFSSTVGGYEGAIYLFSDMASSWTHSRTASEADVTILGTHYASNLGSAMLVTDIDDDGADDLLASGFSIDPAHREDIIGLFYGPFSSGTVADEDAVDLVAELHASNVFRAGDTDADGHQDIAFAWMPSDLVPDDRIYLYTDTPSGALLPEDMTGSIAGESIGSSFAPAGDVDGDGYGDVVVGDFSQGFDGRYYSAGAAYLFRGPIVSRVTVEDAWATWLGEDRESAGLYVDGGRDIDGDGGPDFVVGGGANTEGNDTVVGRVYVVYAPTAGTWNLATDASAILYPADEALGIMPVTMQGDVDADGRADILLGASDADHGQGLAALWLAARW